MQCPFDLKKRYRDGRVILFIGAGVSMSVKWQAPGGEESCGPSWQGLVDQAAKRLGYESPELLRARGTDLQILEYFKLKHNDQIAKLTNWLAKLDPPDEDLKTSPIHRALAALDRCRLFYTTNYDNFLERAFSLHGRGHRVVAVESQMGVMDKGCEIVKFHGDLEHPDQIVLTESDYERRLSLTTHLDHRLRSDLLGRVLLFIGYSFRDPNVSYLFRLFTEHFRDQPGSLPGDRAFIVVPNPSDFEQRLFEARHMKVIQVPEHRRTEAVAELLEDMGS